MSLFCHHEACNEQSIGSTAYCKAHAWGYVRQTEACDAQSNQLASDTVCYARESGERDLLDKGRKASKLRPTGLSSSGGGDQRLPHGRGDTSMRPEALNSPRKQRPKCQSAGCLRNARDGMGLCVSHGGGRRCGSEGCDKLARGRRHKEGREWYCAEHGGDKRTRPKASPEVGSEAHAVFAAHMGGRRCGHEGCDKSASSASGLCQVHVQWGKRGGSAPLHGAAPVGPAAAAVPGKSGAMGRPNGYGMHKRCSHEGCSKFVRPNMGTCQAHGRHKQPDEYDDFVARIVNGADGGDAIRERGGTCKHEECDETAEAGASFCVVHRGSRPCWRLGCSKHAAGTSGYCSAHGGGKRCAGDGCLKFAQPKSQFCRAHGGGAPCQHKGCRTLAADGKGLCVAHGGGKRCQVHGCDKSAQGGTKYCCSHNGGRRCEYAGCTSSSAGSTKLCRTHGGGKRCQQRGCVHAAAGATEFCLAHGGGKRCQHQGCKKSAIGSTQFCIAHGGGVRCSHEGCAKSAKHNTRYCVSHGGGRRCALSACTQVARSVSPYCKVHEGGMPCQRHGCLKLAESNGHCLDHANHTLVATSVLHGS